MCSRMGTTMHCPKIASFKLPAVKQAGSASEAISVPSMGETCLLSRADSQWDGLNCVNSAGVVGVYVSHRRHSALCRQ